MMHGYEMFLAIKYLAVVIGGLAGLAYLLSRPRGRF